MAQIRERRAPPQPEKLRSARPREHREARNDCRTERCEPESMREVTMIFDRQQRIGFAANKHVCVRNKRRKSSDPGSGATQLVPARRITETGAKQDVRKWIHDRKRSPGQRRRNLSA